MVVFSDFECSHCATFASNTWPLLRDQYVASGRLLVAFRNWPLDPHPHAYAAAAAANCAGAQGMFWPMHDKLFELQGRLTSDSGRRVASQLKLNMSAFDDCTRNSARAAIGRDIAAATTLKLSGTPTFLVGRLVNKDNVYHPHLLAGARPLEEFQHLLEQVFAEPGPERQ
jgi:protein-disulfide isomerase